MTLLTRPLFKIWCEVRGGVTGYRCGALKRDGKEVIFERYDDAQREADRLMEQANGNPFRKATFLYTVVEMARGAS